MTNVSDLNRYRMQRTGSSMFLTCQCGGNEWLAVCVANSSSPVISGLVCPDCEQELPVAYGKVDV